MRVGSDRSSFAAQVLCCALWMTYLGGATAKAGDPPEQRLTLGELIALPEEELAKVDIAETNLICAEGLRGSEDFDRQALLAKLDRWAWWVAYETNRHRYHFEQHPEEYNHSYGEFAMLMMVTVLQQDLGVHYEKVQIAPDKDPRRFDFKRSQDLFINGLLTGSGGTCTSMPVLYIAIGRRLGYPLKLVTTPEHNFVRWEDPETGERFNIEATMHGYGSHPDEFYRFWPRRWNSVERQSKILLKSLTPRQELAVFLTTRGDHYFFCGRFTAALISYKTALRLSPASYNAAYQYGRTKRYMERLKARREAELAAREVQAGD